MQQVKNIDLKIEDEIATVVINRPDKLNALNEAMLEELGSVCANIESDSEIRVIIISGIGDKSFSAGGDIEAWSKYSPENFGRSWIRRGHDIFAKLARLRQPAIAVLNGHALGGGLELAACADYRIGETHIKIGQPETGLGVLPGWSGTQRAVRRFGSQVVKRMVLFGEIFTAEKALSVGILDQVVESGSGMKTALELTNKICTRAPLATEISKMQINIAENEEMERPIDVIASMAVSHSAELEEGLTAFREKRKPNFSKQSKK